MGTWRAIVFAGVLGVFAAFVGWADGTPRIAGFFDDALQPAAAWAAAGTAASLRALGFDVVREGHVVGRAGGAAVSIGVGCLGFPMLSFLIVAMAAYAAPLRCKLIGIPSGLVVLSAVNLVRFVHLFWLSDARPDHVAFTHDVTWRVLTALALLAVWFAWRHWSDLTSASAARAAG